MHLSELEGRLLAGRFQLGKLLGQGGYGAVFEAEQVSMGRKCAVKVLAPHLVDSEDTVRRFELEARATSKLTHPNTIVVYDFGRDAETGLLFLAMEYLDGLDLEDFARQRETLAPGEVAHIVAQMAGSLQEAHDAGLVHRDVKPRNAMVLHRGNDPLFVKVIDFGISKAFDPLANQSASFMELTGTGMVVGTPQYMSPEQLRNDGVDGRSDQYALGITAYRLLTGRVPFQADSLVDIAVKHISEPPTPLREMKPDLAVSDDFENAIMRSLAKGRDDRFSSVLEFAQTLSAAVGGATTTGPTPDWSETPTASLQFDSSFDSDTDEMAGEPMYAAETGEAFAPTAALPAMEPAAVHLGGTLVHGGARKGDRPGAKAGGAQDGTAGKGQVSAGDAPGSTLVVLRDQSGEESPAGAESQHEPESKPGTGLLMPTGERSSPAQPAKTSRALVAFAAVAGLGLLAVVAVVLVFAGLEPSGKSELAAVEAPADQDAALRADENVEEHREPSSDMGVAVETAPERAATVARPAKPSAESNTPKPVVAPTDEVEPSETAAVEEPAEVEPNDAVPTEDIAEPKTGRASVVLMPWGELWIDGKRRGEATRQRVELPEGTHTFELRQGGKVRDRKRITIEADRTHSVRLRAR